MATASPSRQLIGALLDVAHITCAINVHEASVMRSLWTPGEICCQSAAVNERKARLGVTVTFPSRVIKVHLWCKLSF